MSMKKLSHFFFVHDSLIDLVSLNLYDLIDLGDSGIEGLGSLYELADCMYPKGSRDLEERLAIELVLSSASRCHHCASILYDEEIMAGWQPEDSNLNTVCQFCDKATVPLLTITIFDYRYFYNMCIRVVHFQLLFFISF